jgi:hypothetical protein
MSFIISAVGIAFLAAVFFHRFDPARIQSNWLDRLMSRFKRTVVGFVTQPTPVVEPGLSSPEVRAQTVHLTPTSIASYRSGRLRRSSQLLFAEWKLAFSGVRWWWYLVTFGLIVGSLLAPLHITQLVLLPVIFVWPLSLWSTLGARETRLHTESLVLSGPYPLRRQFVAMWGVGVLITLGMSAGVIFRLIMSGAWAALAGLIIGVIFIPTLALAMGCWSGTNKLFEAVYLFFWYLVAVQNIPYLDFLGRFPEMIQIGIPWIYAGIALVLFGVALLGRRHQVIH